MLIHLAFMSSVYMDLIKIGEKTIESRLYKTSNRDHPAMRAGVKDIILFKRTGGNVEAIAKFYTLGFILWYFTFTLLLWLIN